MLNPPFHVHLTGRTCRHLRGALVVLDMRVLVLRVCAGVFAHLELLARSRGLSGEGSIVMGYFIGF